MDSPPCPATRPRLETATQAIYDEAAGPNGVAGSSPPGRWPIPWA